MEKRQTVLIATGERAGMEAMIAYRPLSLLPIVDKPAIHHTMEYLYLLGVRECHIILHHLPQLVRRELGDGKRFGIDLHYHLAKDPHKPFRTLLPLIGGFEEENLLLASEATLPHFPFHRVDDPLRQPTLIVSSSKKWTEWGYFTKESLREIPLDTPYGELPLLLQKGWKSLNGKLLFSLDSYRSLKKSNIKGIAKNLESLALPTTAKEIKKGLFIAKGATLHSKSTINPPVYIGENSRIEEGAVVGPNVVVEKNCLIDKNSCVKEALICSNSYIGESITISESLVDKNLLVNTSLETELTISEEFILGKTGSMAIKEQLFNHLERMAAIAALLLLSPLILCLLPFSSLEKKRVLALPKKESAHKMATFELFSWKRGESLLTSSIKEYPRLRKLISAIPKLLNIARGELHFAGLPPRTAEEVEKLPATWKNLYLQAKIGIVNLADVEQPLDNSSDHLFASEIYQSVNSAPLFDLILIARWLITKNPSTYNDG